MSVRMTALAHFCNTLVAFFEDLSETYPEEGNLSKATQTLKLAKQANPRLVHSMFMEHVYDQAGQQILNEDEDFLIAKAQEKLLNKKKSQLASAYWIFEKHWATMTETNKQHVWRYIKTIVLLATRVT